jgi:hypothetical protein
MPHQWSDVTQFVDVVLDVEEEQRACPVCGRRMTVCDHRRHPIYTLKGPHRLVCRLVKCPNRDCPQHHRTASPQSEALICRPKSILGWDVFCWIGQRRFSRHWSVPQIRAELKDSYDILVSADALEDVVAQYQAMLAAREQDPQRMAEVYRDVAEILLSIDGLQPEKGHETLYVVRELTLNRVWFGEALVCSSAEEVRRLIAQAREWAERLGLRVRAWMSDKQDAFVSGIAAEFPGVPHRLCQNHFLRDLAQPVREADSHAKVGMRKKVRGLRTIERDLLAEQRATEAAAQASSVPPHEISHETNHETSHESGQTASSVESATAVVLDYCTAVKGILNDDQGGPLQPPGVRMAESLQSVRESLERNIQAKKGGLRKAR